MPNKLLSLGPNRGRIINFPNSAMTETSEGPRRKKKKSRVKFSLYLAIGLMSLAVFLWGPQFKHIQQMNGELAELQSQKEQLQQNNIKLKDEINQLNSDKAVEKIAREKLGLVKPGEKMLIEVKPAGN